MSEGRIHRTARTVPARSAYPPGRPHDDPADFPGDFPPDYPPPSRAGDFARLLSAGPVSPPSMEELHRGGEPLFPREAGRA